MPLDAERFVVAQADIYPTALAELRAGHKRSHWMWFIFPQLAGLGRSQTAQHYALADIHAARAYLAHPLLGPRLLSCCEALMPHTAPIGAILGPPDDLKLRSCLTLFNALPGPHPHFSRLLTRFYQSVPCPMTQALLATP
ncbi:DUF1810 domain-containing protein [Simiduia sp. 21SJ11W-1]|uniref:DUF1810 domain-containing protein n=1 Tax=Simiduia sp. 21SJ11W-1 TaxID=2909669 RepID=UPI00209EE40E|nr:DUF1810 domain-containing protein [Simiduia sp. 21SJ11W-1]UTA47267.1 DUF1810 domain-containing protein [Simiduia sp. 21SJ11W-1]